MESVLGKLQKVLIGNRSDIDSSLAKEILKNFQKGVFASQSELSHELFISNSVITKFCKKLGYSGFRQFNELLRMEHQKYALDRYKQVADSKLIKDMLSNSLENVDKNSYFFKSFRQEVLDKKALTILPSYQSENAGMFLHDYLLDKNINVKVWNPAKNFMISVDRYIGKDEPILFIFTGPDNYLNYSNFEYLKFNKDHKVFIITTNGQTGNFDAKYKYILKSNVKYSNAFVRQVLLELLFLETFE